MTAASIRPHWCLPMFWMESRGHSEVLYYKLLESEKVRISMGDSVFLLCLSLGQVRKVSSYLNHFE